MTDAPLHQALAFARHGWRVFPCQPGQKIPATAHGYRDATTDEQQITDWFTRHPDYNLAIATGAPGPDVLDIDQHGPAGNGYEAFDRLRAAGLADGAAAWIRTPSGGMHAYFAGSDQRSGRLPRHHLDFRSAGRLRPGPALPDRRPPLRALPKLQPAATAWTGPPPPASWNPSASPAPSAQRDASGLDLSHLARWVAAQPHGNRNSGLYWAANRALDTDAAADLSPLAVAARQAGLRRPRDHPHPRLRPPHSPGPAPSRDGGLT